MRADTAAGLRSVMIAGRRGDVVDLATRARLDRVAAGEVELDGVRLRDGTTAGGGDHVVTRENRADLPLRGTRDRVKNGDTWTVLARHADGSLDVAHHGHRGRIRLPAEYVRERVELAYAATVHRTQGATVDTTHALIDGTATWESLYVTATRGRHSNRLYVVTDGVLDLELHHPPGSPRTARQVLEDVLARDGAERSATDTVRDSLAATASLATLAPEYEHADRLLTRPAERYSDTARAVLGAHADAVLRDPAWPALADALARDSIGLDPQRTLATNLARRPVDDARSIAEALHSRLHRYIDTRLQTAEARSEGLPDWLARPPSAAEVTDPGEVELAEWLAARARQIGQRARELADQAAELSLRGRGRSGSGRRSSPTRPPSSSPHGRPRWDPAPRRACPGRSGSLRSGSWPPTGTSTASALTIPTRH